MPACANSHFIPYWHAPVETVAQYIIAHAANLPDLTDVRVVISEPRAAADFRRALLRAAAERQTRALLGPQVLTHEQWLAQFLPEHVQVCSQQQRLLILVEALFEQPALLGQANAWTLADSLLDLFDELTLNHVSLSDDIDQFTRQLGQWYATRQLDLPGLQHEARLLHGLWRAWHTQLQSQDLTDIATAQILCLQHSLGEFAAPGVTHFIGVEPQQRAQIDWFRQLLNHERVHFWWHGSMESAHAHVRPDSALRELCSALDITPGDTPEADVYHESLARVFSESPPLHQRARLLQQDHSQSPLRDRIAVFSANNAEQEANAIDIQCREWLLAGKQHIAIITENRRLARRVRALLERAGIVLQDAAGWALSTTRAAATIEALLLCIEDDFAKDALLDLCKSPYLFPDLEREQLRTLVYRLEHDIIQNEGISNGLTRYQAAIHDRADRLSTIWNLPPSQVSELLQRLGDACQPLLVLRQRRQRAHGLPDYLNALSHVLDDTGLRMSLSQDAAGELILQQLDAMQLAAQSQPQQRHWRDFRAWLGRNLEKSYFRPGNQHSAVELLSLSQSQLRHFDAIIFAAAEQEYLPGAPAGSPFFNNAVRMQLGLSTREQFNHQRLREFYRLLHSAPSILISHRAEQDGEPITASPWLAALVSFHHIAYADDLQTSHLHALLRSGQAMVWRCDTKSLPARQHQPRPQAEAELVPASISASAYQSLLDCPYQFFATRCLQLSPPEEVREVLSKREYGERVHLCLQAFHSDLPRYPGPFPQPITDANKHAAITLLKEISEVVFRQDLLDNYTHRGWYHQWCDTIPVYIEWQLERNREWQVDLVEYQSESRFNDRISIKGRLDRLDQGKDGYAILDYKSGQTPTLTNIRNGENIQLPFYALLAQAEGKEVNRVEYLQIGKAGDFKSAFPQTGETLQQLTQEIGKRLQDLMHQLEQGAGLPAWEDEASCRYCDARNLCRVGGWQEADGESE
ncbi:MAG: PD-(D/E)XK nuclease family protein [Gammaproteobacteria bacterium]